ncbi:OmpA family protein [Puniceibacterium sediminis]|uniref:OmpA-OmpF porin, OOP family n=1 Tax=Puniceibacterium sediminis TaxID=1608407 RepID=A0A238WRT2_9RHOB|nr:OmpA family protein [Puniceibacterium sediminis]SNR49246.1 OmpA-OmpF porin, OOP family [Puniceibacterium sediminis]
MTNITHKHAKALRLATLVLLVLSAPPAAALDLSLPLGARLTTETATVAGSYRLPTGPWGEEGLPTVRIEGAVTRQAWRLDGQSATTQQIMARLRDQITEAGYDIVLDCNARICGGFDFRFNTEVLRGPDMYVDLTDFRFLSARTPDGDGISLLVSRSAAAGFIQIVRASPVASPPLAVTPSASPVLNADSGPLSDRLEISGHVVLRDLQFPSGVSDLGDGPIASLDTLAAYLEKNPDARITFVGHTDATGSLSANIALSRRRAMAAVTYLRNRYDIAADRLEAEGVGYLSPLSTNLTEEGRLQNRRIEAVLMPGA